MNLQLHEPCCETLYVHLPGQNGIVIGEDDDPEEVEKKLSKADSPLQVSYTLVYKSGRQKWETKPHFFFSINPDQNFGFFFLFWVGRP